MKISRHYTTPINLPTRRSNFAYQKAKSATRTARWSFPSMKLRFLWIGARSRQISSPKNISEEPGFGPSETCRRSRRPFVSLALRARHCRTRGSAAPARYGSEHSAVQVFDRLVGAWTYWAGRAIISTESTTLKPFSMSSASCWRGKSRRRTLRNGSTPAFTGPMASTALARAITTSTLKPIRLSNPNPLMSARNRMPALSSRSLMISSMTAASWTSGCARHGSSNMAPALNEFLQTPWRKRKTLQRR